MIPILNLYDLILAKNNLRCMFIFINTNYTLFVFIYLTVKNWWKIANEKKKLVEAGEIFRL